MIGGAWSKGITNENSAPPADKFFALIVPPCASIIDRQIASPSPTPLCVASFLTR